MSNTENNLNFNHSHISITSLNKKFYGVSLKNNSDDKEADKWEDILNESLEYSKENKCWIVNNKEIKEFICLIKNLSNDNSESESESESESSTDDELIQKTLTRRLTSQSKQHSIEQDHASDSEMEDVVSLTRRIRYLYKTISELEKRVSKLEQLRD
jgi:hypothetical protein